MSPPSLSPLPDVCQGPRALEVVPGVGAVSGGFPRVRVGGDAVEPDLVAPVNSHSTGVTPGSPVCLSPGFVPRGDPSVEDTRAELRGHHSMGRPCGNVLPMGIKPRQPLCIPQLEQECSIRSLSPPTVLATTLSPVTQSCQDLWLYLSFPGSTQGRVCV